ncbi:hypothetical protein BDZ91DRAFT_792088 [Kalaharituber pfeilii]|nr:hypothetical protein BDZ91DRAFT_792088 [Kalaharituber pfeilii]
MAERSVEDALNDIEAPQAAFTRRFSVSTLNYPRPGSIDPAGKRRRTPDQKAEERNAYSSDGSRSISSAGVSSAGVSSAGVSKRREQLQALNSPSNEGFWTQYNVIVEIATALIEYGAPSHRVEIIVSAIGNAFSIQTAFYYLPTFAVIQFPSLSSSGNFSAPSALYLIKRRGSMNFHKLPQLFDLVKELLRKGIDCDEIRSRLEKIKSAEQKAKEFPEWAIALSYPFAAMTSAVMFFHGTWKDALVSGALGLIPGLLRLVANRFDTLWWTYEIIACFLVSLVATALAPYFCYSTLILSAPVALLPGYTVTAAAVEIMTKNIVAGAVRLCYTVVYLACMIYGMTFASVIYHAQGNTSGIGFQRKPSEEVCLAEGKIHPNHLWLLLCVPLYIIAYNVYLRAPLHQWPSMIAVGSLGYAGGYVCKHIWHSPPEMNGFSAALLIGLGANIYARITDNFSFNTIVAGVFIQVPGSWGARGMLALAYAEYDRGLYYCYQMLVICVGIAGAL